MTPMRSRTALLSALTLALSGAGTAGAAAPAPEGIVVVDGARFQDFRSRVTGRDYRLFISVPDAPAPKAGFPVVYVLDGNSHFYTAVSVARAQSMFGEIRPAIVVGVGYPLSRFDEILKTRNRDLTTPITAEALARMPPNPGLTPDNTGGLDAFLEMIETEVKPRVAGLAPVDASDQTLFGHSLGGLAVVRALMTRPEAYRTFVSASPSLFWNDRAVLADEAALEARIRSGAIAPRVLLMAGALEGSSEGYRTGGVPMTQAQVDGLISVTRMTDNPAALGQRLAAVKGGPGYRVQTVIFPDESHLSVIPAAISRAFNFALSVDGDGPPARAPDPRP